MQLRQKHRSDPTLVVGLLLPPAEVLLPRLWQIEAARIFSNFGPQVTGLECPTEDVVYGLAGLGIATRRWCRGLYEKPAFAAFGRDGFEAAAVLAEFTLGLPHYRDMQRLEVAQVRAALGEVLSSLFSCFRAKTARVV